MLKSLLDNLKSSMTEIGCRQLELPIWEIMVHIIAQSLRMAINVQAKRRETSELKFPDDSVEKLLSALKRVRAVRAPTRATWVVEPLSKKAQDMLELLDLPKPSMTFKSM